MSFGTIYRASDVYNVDVRDMMAFTGTRNIAALHKKILDEATINHVPNYEQAYRIAQITRDLKSLQVL